MEKYNNDGHKDDDLVLREPIAIYDKKIFSIEEYLEYENASQEKHEYYNGEIFTMAGASWDHCVIARNLIVMLANALRKTPCQPFGSDLRMHIPSNTLFTYPDIAIFCKDMSSLMTSETSASLPTVLIEILSPSTRNYDRGKKFELYKDVPSFQEYILVDSVRFAIDIYRKNAEGVWVLEQYTIKDRSIKIKALDLNLSFKRIYEEVQFKERVTILNTI